MIGSGELQEDNRRHARSHGIFEALQSPQFEQVYEGRDGLTEVEGADRRTTGCATVRNDASRTEFRAGQEGKPVWSERLGIALSVTSFAIALLTAEGVLSRTRVWKYKLDIVVLAFLARQRHSE